MKKFLKIGCLGFIVLIVLIIVIGIIGSNGDDKNSTANKSKNTEGTVEKNDTAKEETEQLAKIGEELQVGDVIFKVNKVTSTKEIKDGGLLVL